MDFVSDTLLSGRLIRVLAVVDTWIRELRLLKALTGAFVKSV
jgi:hypothetical protein